MYVNQGEFLEIYAKRLAENPRLVLAIDGCCGSGKTTLAQLLNNNFGTSIIHIDDFFLQPFQRTENRFAEIGGNIDYERFELEVLRNIQENRDIIYRKFDCSLMALGEEICIKKGGAIVVEGVYSLSPRFCAAYNLKLFLEISKDEQHKRILNRSGCEMLKRFISEWIPLENKYFSCLNIAQAADFIIK